MITEYLIKQALDAAIDISKKILRESVPGLRISREDVEESIRYHLQLVRNWSA